jgi:hypothetical protein
MRQWMQAVGMVGLVVLVGLCQCSQENGRPRAGETVTPHLAQPVFWTAGASGGLGVRLYAKGADAKAARWLDFGAIPWDVNPVADLAFYRGDQPLSTLQVALSHRC